VFERSIHERRRLMPYLEARFGPRMRQEFVVVSPHTTRNTLTSTNVLRRRSIYLHSAELRSWMR
jgi:hypothetical protein